MSFRFIELRNPPTAIKLQENKSRTLSSSSPFSSLPLPKTHNTDAIHSIAVVVVHMPRTELILSISYDLCKNNFFSVLYMLRKTLLIIRYSVQLVQEPLFCMLLCNSYFMVVVPRATLSSVFCASKNNIVFHIYL